MQKIPKWLDTNCCQCSMEQIAWTSQASAVYLAAISL